MTEVPNYEQIVMQLAAFGDGEPTNKFTTEWYKFLAELATLGAASGTVVMFAGSTAPSGWFFCFGAAISRSAFSDLFAAIGTTYGVGDGSTTFNVPQMVDRVPISAGNLYSLADTADMGGSTPVAPPYLALNFIIKA